MALSDEDIRKFQALYKSTFGTEISREAAYESGIKLLRLMSFAYKPMTEQELQSIQEHRRNTLALLQEKLNNRVP